MGPAEGHAPHQVLHPLQVRHCHSQAGQHKRSLHSYLQLKLWSIQLLHYCKAVQSACTTAACLQYIEKESKAK